MKLKVDHLVFATRDLAHTTAQAVAKLGVTPSPGGSHPGWGTRNLLVALGDDVYLELIGPDPGQPPPVQPRPFEIDDMDAPRLATWAVKASGLEARVERARRAGVELGAVRSMSRQRPDGSILRWRLTVPPLLQDGGIIPFLIDWSGTESPARGAVRGCRLNELRAYHPEPDAVGRRLRAMDVELAVEQADIPRLEAVIETPNGEVRLV